MFDKQKFFNWLKPGIWYTVATFCTVGISFILASFVPTFFGKYLSTIAIEWITFLLMLIGFSLNIYIDIFKLKKKFSIGKGVFWYFIFAQILFCVIDLLTVINHTLE